MDVPEILATIEDSYYAPIFAKIFHEMGVSMDSPYNRLPVLGHIGPHSDEYHEYILALLEHEHDKIKAIYGKNTKGSKRQFEKVLEELGTRILQNKRHLLDMITIRDYGD